MISNNAVRDICNRAQSAADVAVNRYDPHSDHEHVDPALLDKVYAGAVEDLCLFLLGDHWPTEALVQVLRAGRVNGDDLPEDAPESKYPPLEV